MSYDTKQSKLVYDYLKRNKEKHFSAEEVYFGLLNEGGKIGRTTVYRQLDKLVDGNKVRKLFTGENEPYCYQFSDCVVCPHHHHLKCTKCGKLFHMECEFLDKVAEHIFEEHQFTVDTSKIVLYGICEDCMKENKDI